MMGTVRVVSRRKGGLLARDNETIVMVDRTHHVLGNRHVLHDHTNREERTRVIAAYAADFERDMAAGGPMWAAVRDLTRRVQSGENIALCCWCAPRFCHGDLIRGAILGMLRDP